MRLRKKKPEPDWMDAASWQVSLQHFDEVWAARYASLSARVVALETGVPLSDASVERV